MLHEPHTHRNGLPRCIGTRCARSRSVGCGCPPKAAIREPAAAGYINAVQVYPFAEGVLYRLYTAPGRVSDIALEPGESLASVAAGDTARWTVGDTVSGSGETRRTHLLVKPFAAGLSTNLVIATDRRVYHVELTSTGSRAMTAIRWTYPQNALLALSRRRAARGGGPSGLRGHRGRAS
ncbi:TrbG/VirB9 family P-type conjugative transfer protein [Sphingopyxis terrae]|uniref:TrbG/VirB9 family P-type conjugative transfer protein n=1 Tax=Sphingopyxis terrae TaxID=33052 RepID=UPI003617B8A0